MFDNYAEKNIIELVKQSDKLYDGCKTMRKDKFITKNISDFTLDDT
jgi:hypothetical protein